MNPKLNDKSRIEEILRLNSLFYPREHWSNPSPLTDRDVRNILVFMQAAKAQQLLATREELIDKHRFDHRPEPGMLSRKKRALWLVAARRHGGEDLKTETWSAVQYLCQRFPEELIEPYWDGLPYCCVVREQGLVVTAGNVSPVTIVRFMLKQNTPQLAIVGERLFEESEWRLENFRDTGQLCLRWIVFDPRAFTALKEHLAEQERELQRATEEALSQVFRGISAL